MSAATGSIRQAGMASVALAIGTTVLLWASAFPAIRLALTAFSPGELAWLRFAIASSVLAVHWLSTRPALPSGRALGRVVLSGAMGITLYNLALNHGETRVDAGTASMLMGVGPIFAALLGVMFAGERLSWLRTACVGMSFAGVALIAFPHHGYWTFNQGALLVLAAALCQAIQFTLQKPLAGRFTALSITSCVIWAGTLLLTPFAPSALAALPHASAPAIGAVVFLGVGPAAMAYLTWSYALSRYPVSQAVSFLYLIPPVSLLVSFGVLGEQPTLQTIAGGVLALLGVIGVNALGKRG